MEKKIVYVMMSGGVDSSVAAADLVQSGYEVRGVFMKCWSQTQLKKIGLDPEFYACSWEEDEVDAKMVAKKLNIPFQVWDFQEEYFNNVVDYMVKSYQSGITPNPDVMCNSTIKFGVFYKEAMKNGADFVATGHYAKDILNEKTGLKEILRGGDKNKDQSYFLWRIGFEQMQKSLFPVGKYDSKTELRERAKKLGLTTSQKPDSQGICFIGDTPLREILLKVLGKKEGYIKEIGSEKKLGKHQGAFLYTIGQRNGLGLSNGPWFVKSIDVNQNIVWVVHENQKTQIFNNKLIAGNINWLIPEFQKKTSFNCTAQIRYRQKAHPCKITVLNNGEKLEVDFIEKISAITPGQSLVIYDQDRMIGGGIIL